MKSRLIMLWIVLLALSGVSLAGADLDPFVEITSYEDQVSKARLEPVKLEDRSGFAVVFEGTDDLHYYASPKTAPGGFNLNIEADSENIDFNEPMFPPWSTFYDNALQKDIEVYVGDFTVFIPVKDFKSQQANVKVTLTGLACTSQLCLSPFEKTLEIGIDFDRSDSWWTLDTEIFDKTAQPASKQETIHQTTAGDYSTWFALTLAFIAGLTLNIMPCVLPVIPLIVFGIVNQAKENRAKCVAMGLVLCLGILSFFAIIAAGNIVLRIVYGTVFQWGDHFRNPVFLMAMALLMVALSMFMFGAVTFVAPSVASKSDKSKGYLGSLGMGFLAALLSTPCSFAILTAAFAWAQTQKLPLATIAIMLIGVGMMTPYAILISIPGTIKYIPKPGKWMELFKKSMGFILLFIGVKLLLSLPQGRRAGVLNYAVILSFCIWMWGSWVDLMTPRKRKYIVRSIAPVIAVIGGMWFLRPPAAEIIDWTAYNRSRIEQSLKQDKPVLIKFYADWCLTCKAVDATVYSREDIAELIEQKAVVAIKADTTEKDDPATIDLKEVYNEPGVPVSMLFIPDKEDPERLHGLLIGDRLKELLESLPDKEDASE